MRSTGSAKCFVYTRLTAYGPYHMYVTKVA